MVKAVAVSAAFLINFRREREVFLKVLFFIIQNNELLNESIIEFQIPSHPLTTVPYDNEQCAQFHTFI